MYTAKNYINGQWYSIRNGEMLTILNPANKNEIAGKAQFADKGAIENALLAAETAFTHWVNTSFSKRKTLLKKCIELIIRNKTDLKKWITLENGKTFKESEAEIDSATDEANYQIDFLEKGLTEHLGKNEIRYTPLGVVLLVTPWNFPLATVLRKLIPALLCGNTVILKTSELTPLTSAFIFDIIEKTGLPDGIVNLLLGRGSDIVPALLISDTIKAVSLTGSDRTGKEIARYINNRNIRFQAEMGGSNAVVILNDAHIESAVSGIVSNGFCCAGQWCTGTTRVIAEKNIYNKTIALLRDRVERIKVGPGNAKTTDMGPLISLKNLEALKKTVEAAIDSGASLVFGGQQISFSESTGNFFQPTILSDIEPSMKIAQQEVFGPVLTLFKANNFEHAVELVNSSQYGLSCSIYTQNKILADKFLCQVDAGLCHVNLPTGFRDFSMPLLGWKESGWGIAESGRFMRDFFTQTKAIYRN